MLKILFWYRNFDIDFIRNKKAICEERWLAWNGHVHRPRAAAPLMCTICERVKQMRILETNRSKDTRYGINGRIFLKTKELDS